MEFREQHASPGQASLIIQDRIKSKKINMSPQKEEFIEPGETIQRRASVREFIAGKVGEYNRRSFCESIRPKEIGKLEKLIQCVPNFSEGRRPDVVKSIVEAISLASNVNVVNYSWDVDHNRSVVTMLGIPDDIRKSMLAGAAVAVKCIDLNHHTGGHPRIGAVDVIPVVPIADTTMSEAVELSRLIGDDIASQLGLPVFFYEESATTEARRNLAVIRKGGFEALKSEGLIGNRTPDLGPFEIHPTAGAVAVGARGPLIAYNVNLATDDVLISKKIAAAIRRLRNNGSGMPGVKAIGVYLASRGIAQVSTNITRPDLITIYDVYSFIEREAKAMGVEVLESELIGAMREQTLIDAVRSAMRFPNLAEDVILDTYM